MTGLTQLLTDSGQAATVYDVCLKTMGGVGIILAMIGVIACPITSGDTAFRSARLVIADWFKINQKSYKKRLVICVPLLLVGAIICQLNLQYCLEIFQLVKSDFGNDCVMGSINVLV